MNSILRQSKRFIGRNVSSILTCVGAVGVVATAILTAKATPKALSLIEEAEKEKGEDLTKTETILVAGPTYIPAILTGLSTITCMFSVNILNKRHQAALMSVYTLLSNSYQKYKDKIDDLYGEAATIRVREEIAKAGYEKSDVQLNDNKELFYDLFSGRYFESTVEDVQRAEYQINRDLVMRGYVYLNEFYEYLDISPIEAGYKLGWSTGGNLACYWQSWIDFTHEKVVMEDGLECLIIAMTCDPIIDFENYN